LASGGRAPTAPEPGEKRMAYQWDWQVFCKDTIDGTPVAGCMGKGADATTYLDWMISAWGLTLSVAVLARLVALSVGAFMVPRPPAPDKRLPFLGNAWVELFRNTPLLVQLFVWYHVVPSLFPIMRSVPPFALVVFGLGFFTSARVAEQVRAG